MDQTNFEYVASERFIHDGLLRQAEAMVGLLLKEWKYKDFPDLYFAWPGEPVKGDDGKVIDEIVSMQLPMDADRRKQAFEYVDRRVKPYGTMLIETKSASVDVSFKTSHGSIEWSFPIEDHGDVKVLGRAVRTEIPSNHEGS